MTKTSCGYPSEPGGVGGSRARAGVVCASALPDVITQLCAKNMIRGKSSEKGCVWWQRTAKSTHTTRTPDRYTHTPHARSPKHPKGRYGTVRHGPLRPNCQAPPSIDKSINRRQMGKVQKKKRQDSPASQSPPSGRDRALPHPKISVETEDLGKAWIGRWRGGGGGLTYTSYS